MFRPFILGHPQGMCNKICIKYIIYFKLIYNKLKLYQNHFLSLC